MASNDVFPQLTAWQLPSFHKRSWADTEQDLMGSWCSAPVSPSKRVCLAPNNFSSEHWSEPSSPLGRAWRTRLPPQSAPSQQHQVNAQEENQSCGMTLKHPRQEEEEATTSPAFLQTTEHDNSRLLQRKRAKLDCFPQTDPIAPTIPAACATPFVDADKQQAQSMEEEEPLQRLWIPEYVQFPLKQFPLFDFMLPPAENNMQLVLYRPSPYAKLQDRQDETPEEDTTIEDKMILD